MQTVVREESKRVMFYIYPEERNSPKLLSLMDKYKKNKYSVIICVSGTEDIEVAIRGIIKNHINKFA